MNFLYPWAEYFRPAKLFTLAFGLAFLIAGALFSGLPDWDISVSLLMALCAYVTAAPAIRVFVERRWYQLDLALFWAWYSVDGVYITYWGFVDPAIVDQLRLANAFASSALYLTAGLVWYYQTTTSSVRATPAP